MADNNKLKELRHTLILYLVLTCLLLSGIRKQISPTSTPLASDHKLIAGDTAGTGILLTVTIIITAVIILQ